MKRSGAIVSRLILLGCLLSIASVATAQRRDQFRGNWSGTLTPNVLLGVPEAQLERLSQPIPFELRVFNRGRVELLFKSNYDEWIFDGRELQLTPIGSNGVILGRFTTKDGSQSAFSLNLTKIDDETLLVNWSKISTRPVLRFDGLDELAFAGTDELKRLDDEQHRAVEPYGSAAFGPTARSPTACSDHTFAGLAFRHASPDLLLLDEATL